MIITNMTLNGVSKVVKWQQIKRTEQERGVDGTPEIKPLNAWS